MVSDVIGAILWLLAALAFILSAPGIVQAARDRRRFGE